MLWIHEAGQGAPLVLLHAVGTTGELWNQHIPLLSEHFRVLSVDLTGHGRSPGRNDALSLDSMAKEIYLTLQNKKLKSVHLVGLSLGGMLAQILALNHTDFVSSLILCDTACEISPQIAEILNDRANTIEIGGMEALVKPTLERWFTRKFWGRHPEVVKTVENLLLEADPKINAATWRAIAEHNVGSRLVKLRNLPSLVINGELDDSIPPGEGERLAGYLSTRLVILPGCAHMAPLEAPDEFVSIVKEFVLNAESK